MIVGGVDTYYDYDEHQWKYRRLGGGPVHKAPAGPTSRALDVTTTQTQVRHDDRQTRPRNIYAEAAEG